MKQFHITQVTQPGLTSLTPLLAWGDPERFCHNVAFLLILPKESIVGERVYGLMMAWVHPYQARVSTIDDMARKLTLLASSGPDWPYVFVQFNGNAHHMPLPKKGHLSAITERMPSNIPCGRICQLEVHQVLHSKAWVVYPEELNRCLVLVITTLPKSLSHGMTMLNDEPTLLQVDLLQFTIEGHESKAPFLSGNSTSTSHTCPAMAPPPKAESQVSMTMEVSELLSWAALDTSGQSSGSSTPKRPLSLALGAPSPLRLEGSAKPVDTFSQVSVPEDAEPDDLTLEEISLPVKTLGLGAGILPRDVIQLQEEAGKALGCLLATRSSFSAHHRKQVSTLRWSSAKLSWKPPRPLKRLSLSVSVPSGKLRPTGQHLIAKQKLSMPPA